MMELEHKAGLWDWTSCRCICQTIPANIFRCIPYLHGLLPDDIEAFNAASPNIGPITKDGFAIMDGTSHQILGTALPKADIVNGQSLWVSRNKLRNVLGKHVNVQYGKRFLRYEEDDGVAVYFKDGSKAQGSVLIGADGASSAVRSQLLPGFQAEESAFTMLNGNVVLPNPEKVLEHSSYGILAAEPGMKSYLLLEDVNLFSWNLSWRGDLAWAQGASREELFQKALENFEHYPEFWRKAIELTGPDGMQKPPIRLLETVLPEELPDGLVTLVGDAAHSMVCNSAFVDLADSSRFRFEGWELTLRSLMRVSWG